MEFERTRVSLTVLSAARKFSVVFQKNTRTNRLLARPVTFEVIEALGDTEEEEEDEENTKKEGRRTRYEEEQELRQLSGPGLRCILAEDLAPCFLPRLNPLGKYRTCFSCRAKVLDISQFA